MTTSPQSTSPHIREDLATGNGPQYRSLLCTSRENRTSSPLQVLNFQGLVWTAGTVLPVLPIPDKEHTNHDFPIVLGVWFQPNAIHFANGSGAKGHGQLRLFRF